MKSSFDPLSLVLCPLLVLAFAGCSKDAATKDGKAQFRQAKATRADVVRTVEATGTVTPRNTHQGIPVGAQVNGRIIKLFVDYNSTVTNGQVVALIDPLVYDAAYRKEVAQLHINEANVEVRKATIGACEAELALCEKTYARKQSLVEKSVAPVSALDDAVEALAKAKADLASAKANLASALASVEHSKASVENAKANLDYCTIRSPVNGIVIDRKVEEGETVVSSYNAVPVLTIAEDLKTIWVEATVPEADVGNIRIGQEVSFTADAYRRRFKGKVKQVRRAHTTTNNVVTYPIIIEAENPDEMLFPGMTATLSIETARAANALTVPAAALRFRPKPEDREPGELQRGRKVWVVGESGKLRPVIVTEGVSDTTSVQITGNDELEGKDVVIGYETAATLAAKKDDTTNPFKPKFPQRGKNKGTAPEPKK